jgi:hypothetical protein
MGLDRALRVMHEMLEMMCLRVTYGSFIAAVRDQVAPVLT